MRTLEQDLKLIKDIYLSVCDKIEFEDEEDEENLFSSLDDTTFNIYDIQYVSWKNDSYEIFQWIDSHWWEWEWEDYWTISRLTIKETWEEIYVKFYWYYSSWEWTERQWIEIVEPKDVMVTQYFNKKYWYEANLLINCN